MLKGISISEGIVISKVYKIEGLNLNIKKINIMNVDAEIIKLQNAIEYTVKEITKIKEIVLKKFSDDKSQIFSSHLLVIQDPALLSEVENEIKKEKINCEYALLKVRNKFIELFNTMHNNEYMKERSFDIKDTTNRTLAYLTNQKYADLFNIKEEVVLVANDLSASEIALLNPKYIKGIVTSTGGQTSHASIITRSLEIPSIIVKSITSYTSDEDTILLDSLKGIVIINPSEDEIITYENKIKELNEQIELKKEFKNKETITKDNYKVKICANVGALDELDNVLKANAEGIGLFRTELLYMNTTSSPTEQKQFEIYKELLQKLEGKDVTIRTLDIGGDKKISYIPFKKEENPFLGNRGIRFCLNNEKIFTTQLRALLRASYYGNLKIMFPMISLIEEFIECKNLVKKIEEELINEGCKIGNYQLGINVEVPSVVFLMDKFVKYVDFFSIGTNDLIQYTFAADRLNEKVDYLYQPLNPSFLRMIKHIIDCAHKGNKKVGMCGEAASNKNLIPLLISYGLDEFSMNSSNILSSRYLISKLNKSELDDVSNKVLECDSSEEVISLLKQE